MACSTPPIYVSTGNSADAFSGSNGLVKNDTLLFSRIWYKNRTYKDLLCGSVYLIKYHDESTNVSIVSVSRLAGP